MEWRDWELFCEVVQHGGFSAAARVLGHPKSSLSAAVQRLEANLGLRLIERTTRHLRLTDAGETIYRRVQPLFAALHDAARAGTAILCASTDYEELAQICDRVLIFARGRIVHELGGAELSKESIAEHCLRSVSLGGFGGQAAA